MKRLISYCLVSIFFIFSCIQEKKREEKVDIKGNGKNADIAFEAKISNEAQTRLSETLTDTIGEFEIGLIENGYKFSKVSDKLYSISITTDTVFGDKVITLNVFASNVSGQKSFSNGCGINLDSIIVSYNTSYKCLKFNKTVFFKNYKIFHRLKIIDLNLDDLPDLIIPCEWRSGTKNRVNDIYVFDSTKNDFIFDEQLSRITNLEFNEKMRVIDSWWRNDILN